MDIEKYISENIDNILDNPDEYIIDNSYNKKKVNFDKKININNYDIDEDEKEYLDYNSEYFENENFEDSEDSEDEKLEDEKKKLEDEKIENEKLENYEKEQNEDDYTDDIISELYQNMYESNQYKPNIIDLFKNIKQKDIENNQFDKYENDQINKKIDINNLNEFENDDGYYFFNLMNIFIKYYNNKYDKTEHFFSNISDLNKDTSSQMEIFFDSIMEFKIIKEKLKLDNDESMKQIYSDFETEKISEMFEKLENKIYMFEMGDIKLFSPSLLVCFNYIYQKNIIDNDWNIYNLRDN
jgi:hypothetical protein